MAPEALAHVLRPLATLFSPADYPDLLVGLGQPDDAAVYRLSEDQALVATVDFFTPIVDDPAAYGAVAAANALSDIYAMGGRPLFALNIAAFPANLPADLLSQVLAGGAEKVREAGVAIAGGHTIQDKEPKYGLVVVGLVDPRRMMTKQGAQPGDKLVLTKPLGTGVLTTAFKQDLTSAGQMAAAVASMTRLNRAASEAALAAGVQAATDITGFGLLGHAAEMLGEEGVSLRFFFDQLPWLPGAQEFGDQWVYPGGAHDNRAYFEARLHFDPRLSQAQRTLCFAPETSGGLLLAVAPLQVDELLARLEDAWLVGEVVAGEPVVQVLMTAEHTPGAG